MFMYRKWNGTWVYITYCCTVSRRVRGFIYSTCVDVQEVEGYVGFANLPNQVYRRSVKNGFDFTLMVVGKHTFHINLNPKHLHVFTFLLKFCFLQLAFQVKTN